MPDQREIHKKSFSKKVEDRLDAVESLEVHFQSFSDRYRAWQDLIMLTQDEDSNVRWRAASTLGSSFSQIPDKDQGWQHLVKLTQDQDRNVRKVAASFLGSAFNHVSNKDHAWQDLIKLTHDLDSKVQSRAAGALVSSFGQVPDKDQAWQNIIMLTLDQVIKVRSAAATTLVSFFSRVPDKDQAWKVLIRLTQDECSKVRNRAADALESAFCLVLNKDQAWQDLVRLTQDEDCKVRSRAAGALESAFCQVPNKDRACQDLQKLAQNENSFVRMNAIDALKSAFSQVSDKDQVWHDLLHRLALDENSFVRKSAVDAMGSAFSHLSDKDQAWHDLHKLTQDEDSLVRKSAADTLGSCFSHVSDKDQAWHDLQTLAQDTDNDVRMYAYHSLGRASVFKAIESKNRDILRHELKSAVAYFERSSKESYYSPARFCHLFYRTYYALAFQKAKEDEVEKYLAEAKEAVRGSASRDDLLKAVENLAQALQESQRLKDRSFQEVANELNACRLYCENAAEHMAAAEDKAPGVVKLMRICNPLLKERIEATIAEIQKKAVLISPEINRAAKSLSLDDPIKAHRCCMRMASALRDSCKRLSGERSELICSAIMDIEREVDLRIVLEKIELAMAYALPAIEAERKEILDLLRNIQFSISNLNIGSGSARKDLYELKTNIRSVQDKMAAQELSMDELSRVLKERDYAMIERLEKMRDDWLMNVEKMAQDLPRTEDTEGILREIREIQVLKQSRRRDILGITGDISSIAGLFIGLMGLAATLKPA